MEASPLAASPPAAHRNHGSKVTGCARCGAAMKKKKNGEEHASNESRCKMHNREGKKEEKELTAVLRRVAARTGSLLVGGVGAGYAYGGGVVRGDERWCWALCGWDAGGRRREKRGECGGGKCRPLRPIYGRPEEIVGTGSFAHDPRNRRGIATPRSPPRSPRSRNCRTIYPTMGHREPTARCGAPDRAGPEATRGDTVQVHLSASVGAAAGVTYVTRGASVPVACHFMRKNRGVEQRCSAT